MRAGVRSHSAKRSLAGILIARSARRKRGVCAMQTAVLGPDLSSTFVCNTLWRYTFIIRAIPDHRGLD